MTVQYIISDRVFTFSEVLQPLELIDTLENLRARPDYISDVIFVPSPNQLYTIEQASDITKSYQYRYVDEMGGLYLLDAKFQIMLAGGTDPNSPLNLPYVMILAMQRWIQKLWAKYDTYKIAIMDNQDVTEIDFSDVGEPPCPFKDIQWVIDPAYQAKEPNRQVNLNKDYYINWQ